MTRNQSINQTLINVVKYDQWLTENKLAKVQAKFRKTTKLKNFELGLKNVVYGDL